MQTLHKSHHVASVTLFVTPCTDYVSCQSYGRMAPHAAGEYCHFLALLLFNRKFQRIWVLHLGAFGYSTGGLGADCGQVGQGKLKRGLTLNSVSYLQGIV